MILSKGELVAVYTPLIFLRADILRNLYLSVLQSYSFEVKTPTYSRPPQSMEHQVVCSHYIHGNRLLFIILYPIVVVFPTVVFVVRIAPNDAPHI